MSYVGRIGVVIETAPGTFMAYRLHGIEAMVSEERSYDDISWDVTRVTSRLRERVVKIEVQGYLESAEFTTPPDWASEPTAEIEAAPRELEG